MLLVLFLAYLSGEMNTRTIRKRDGHRWFAGMDLCKTQTYAEMSIYCDISLHMVRFTSELTVGMYVVDDCWHKPAPMMLNSKMYVFVHMKSLNPFNERLRLQWQRQQLSVVVPLD